MDIPKAEIKSNVNYRKLIVRIKTEKKKKFRRAKSCYFASHKNITSTKLMYYSSAYNHTSFQGLYVSGVSMVPTSQVRSSTMLFLKTEY